MWSQQVADSMHRAFRRAAAKEALRFRRGESSLRSFVWIGPALGVLSMLSQTRDYLRGQASLGSSYGCFAGGFSEGLVPVVLGLVVAFIARWAHHSVRVQAEIIATELGVEP